MRLGGYGRARGLAELRRRAFFIPNPGARKQIGLGPVRVGIKPIEDPLQKPANTESGRKTRLNAGRLGVAIIAIVGGLAFLIYLSIIIWAALGGPMLPR